MSSMVTDYAPPADFGTIRIAHIYHCKPGEIAHPSVGPMNVFSELHAPYDAAVVKSNKEKQLRTAFKKGGIADSVNSAGTPYEDYDIVDKMRRFTAVDAAYATGNVARLFEEEWANVSDVVVRLMLLGWYVEVGKIFLAGIDRFPDKELVKIGPTLYHGHIERIIVAGVQILYHVNTERVAPVGDDFYVFIHDASETRVKFHYGGLWVGLAVFNKGCTLVAIS